MAAYSNHVCILIIVNVHTFFVKFVIIKHIKFVGIDFASLLIVVLSEYSPLFGNFMWANLNYIMYKRIKYFS